MYERRAVCVRMAWGQVKRVVDECSVVVEGQLEEERGRGYMRLKGTVSPITVPFDYGGRPGSEPGSCVGRQPNVRFE